MPHTIRHAFFNPEGKNWNTVPSANSTDPEEQAWIKKVQESGPTTLANLIAGRYGHSDSYLAELSDILENNKHNNTKVVDKAIQQLVGTEDKGRIPKILEHFHASPELLHQAIENERDFGLTENTASGKVGGRAATITARALANQTHLSPEHIEKILEKVKGPHHISIEDKLIKHPAMTSDLINKIIKDPSSKLSDSAIEAILDKHPEHTVADETPERQAKVDDNINNLIHSSMRRLTPNTFDKALDHMSPIGRKTLIDKITGIHGGQYQDEDNAADPDTNWENWVDGRDSDSKGKALAAQSKHLTHEQAEHIMRHGDFDDKWHLFNNEKINPTHANQMYQKWLNDDHREGYDLDALKEKLKEEHEMDHDDWYEEANEKAREEYPLEDYINDVYGRNMQEYEEAKMGTSKEDWMDRYLENNYDWTHKPEQKEGEEEPEEEDLSGRWKTDHPEYDDREREAEEAWNDAAIEADTPDSVIDGYDESLRDRESEIAHELYDDKMDNAHKDPDFLPKHLDFTKEIHTREEDLKNPQTDEKRIDELLHSPQKLTHEQISRAIKHPNANPDTLRSIFEQTHPQSSAFSSKHSGIAEEAFKASDRYEDPEIVQPAINTNKLRQVRDLIEQSGKNGAIPKKEIEKAGFNLKSLGLDKKTDAKGNLTAAAVQEAVDSQPKLKYGVTHSTYKGSQHHSNEPSKVFQLNLSADHFKRLKEAGVAPTFKAMLSDLNSGGHPVNKNRGVGWVRYTEGPNGIHIDEIQSDIGQNFVRQIEAQAKELSRQAKDAGVDSVDVGGRQVDINELNESAQRLKEKYPNIDKEAPIIKEIAFGNEHPNKIIHEAFLQHLRDTGRAGTNVAIWTPESKAPISGQTTRTKLTSKDAEKIINQIKTRKPGANLSSDAQALIGWGQKNKVIPASSKEITPEHLDKLHEAYTQHIAPAADDTEKLPELPVPLPVHMRETYGDHAKEIGYKPSAYGQLDTQTNNEYKGYPTQTMQLRRSETELYEQLHKAMKEQDKIAVAQALMGIQSKQDQIAQLKEQNPEAYQSISKLTQTLVHLFKELAKEPIDAVMHQVQAQEQLEPQDGQQEQTQVKPHVPPKNEKITHGSKELPTGAVRQYDPKTQRTKSPEGDWVSTQSGNKTKDWQ